MRYGTNLSIELKHDQPSSKWYRRFLTRHGLSLQRPKRNQKIPLDEAHARATDFYNFLRRASTWGPKRGDMGAFTPRDVCNFDESPFSLFGDQANRSLNYVNVDNEVENSISSKVNMRNCHEWLMRIQETGIIEKLLRILMKWLFLVLALCHCDPYCVSGGQRPSGSRAPFQGQGSYIDPRNRSVLQASEGIFHSKSGHQHRDCEQVRRLLAFEGKPHN